MNMSHMYANTGNVVWTPNDENLALYFSNISTTKVQIRLGFSYLKGFQRFCYYNESVIPKIREQIEEEDIWKGNNGYLRNYIQYYFSRLLEEKKVLTLKDNSSNEITALMWCIGLTDRTERTPLYAIAVKTTDTDQAAVCQSTGHRAPFMLAITTRNNKSLFTGNHLRSGKDYIKYMTQKLPPLPLAHPLPLAAQFLFDRVNQALVPGQLLMFDAFGITDPSTAIDITHVFPDSESEKEEYDLRKKRIPEKYHHLSDSVLIRRMRDGLTNAVEMAILNPRLGVPQFFNHTVQLLLPISLDEDITNAFVPDVVLALSWNHAQRAYVVETMLTVAMAKGNARLVQRLDQEWLKKSTPESSAYNGDFADSMLGGMSMGIGYGGAGMNAPPAFPPPGLGGSMGAPGFSSNLLGSSAGNNSSASLMGGIGYDSWNRGSSHLTLDFTAMSLDRENQVPVGTPTFSNAFGNSSNHFPIGPPKGSAPSNHSAIGSPIGSQMSNAPLTPVAPVGGGKSNSTMFPSLKSETMNIPSTATSVSAPTASGPGGGSNGGVAWTGASSVAIVNASVPVSSSSTVTTSSSLQSPLTPPPPLTSSPVSTQHLPPHQPPAVTEDSKSAPSTAAVSSSSTTTGAAGGSSSYGLGASKRNMAWESVDWVCPQFGKDCGFGPTKCTHGPVRNGNNGWDAVDWTCPKFGKGCKFGPEKCSHK